jgi:predicted phage terminase large subunit-like protein
MLASRGAWRLYRHLALFNAIALAIAGGEIRNLIIEIPPQHGKSSFWSQYFPAWYIGTFPEKRVVLGSYEAGYASSWGRKCRNVLEEFGLELFGIELSQDSHAADDWSVDGHRGGMVTAGVEGPLSGRSADLAIVDDPIKNAEEAASNTRRAHIKDWWDSVLSTRLSKDGVRVVLMTRWDERDLVGQILEGATKTGDFTCVTPAGEEWTVIRLPAIAEEDENWPRWGWKRAKGEALCPELFPLEELEKRQKTLLDFWWATLYQQRPFPREGGQIKALWFKAVEKLPELDYVVRSWDPAASSNKSAKQTAGVRLGRRGAGEQREYYITDIKADWWESGDRDQEIRHTAETDGKGVHVTIEQEPGSGGKSQAEAIARRLDGWGVTIVVASSEGGKVLRADPLASAAKGGRVFYLKAAWNEKFLEQIRSFPGGKLIDMVDAAAEGFNWLSEQPDPLILPSLPGREAAPSDVTRIYS